MKVQVARSLVTKSVLFVSALSIMTLPVLPVVNVAVGSADSSSSYTTLNNFSGYPGATITVSGGGFAVNETINVVASQNGAQVANAVTKATAGGDYSAALTLPAKLEQGAVNIKATGVTSGYSSTNTYYVTPFSPTLTAGSSDTAPFSTVTIAGSGYAPGEVVNLNLAGAAATATADANGNFKNATLVTPDVPAGSYTIIGVGQASGAKTVYYEYINGFYPSASPNSYYVMPATSLGFNGSGFAANEVVNVTDALDASKVSSFTTDAKGAFTNAGSFSVPASYAGLSKKFVLSGTKSNATTTTSTVIGKYYPNVSPTSYYVEPSTSLAFNGNGFLPGESVEIYNGTTLMTTVKADAKGNLTAAGSFKATPAQAGTNQAFTLKGLSSMGSGLVSVQFGGYSPQASPSGYYVMPGTVVTFSGNGYAPGEIVTIFSGTTTLGSFNTGADGSFLQAGNVTVDYAKANGSLDYKLVGSVSNQPISFTLGVGQLNVMLTPSTYYALYYEEFSVTASGFAPNEKVTLNNGKLDLQTLTTDAKGNVTFKNVSLPYAGGFGVGDLFATGAVSKTEAHVSIALGDYNPTITADNYYAKPGTTVTITGSGFAPNESVVITAGSVTKTIVADAKGLTTTTIVLPFGSATSSLDISAAGQKSNARSTTTITLAPYTPQVSPSTYYATPGTAVSFTGSGFLAGEKISVSLNGKALGNETADAKGNLASTGDYTLPYGKTAEFVLTGLTSGAVNTMNIGLAQFYAGVQLSNYYGNGGSVVTASGSGFAANETVALTSGSTNLGSVTTDAKGAFSKAVTIPYAAPGQVPVTASAAKSGASVSTGFTVAQVYNSVELAKYGVPAGKAITILGSGFFAGEPVTVTSDRGGISYSFKANAQGNLNDSGLVLPPTLKEGELTITTKGGYSYTSHDITFYVQDVNAQ